MSKRLKRHLSKVQIAKRALTVGICILLPIGALLGYSRIKDFYEEKIKIISDEMSGYTVTVYEAASDIKAGQIITEKLVEHKITLSGQKQSSFMTPEDMGGQALIDIPKDTQVLKNMLHNTVIEDTLRELEFSLNIAGENIKEGDYTDIRLRYPDGEDYIVLSKSYINRIDWEKGYLYINLLPEEIHLISSALVDCYLRAGSYLYTTRYIAATYQGPSYVTYTPNENVLKLIEKDPNVIEKARDYLSESDRRGLEERLRNYYAQYGGGQSESYPEADGMLNDSTGDPLYYINGKAGTTKRTSSSEKDDLSEDTAGVTGNDISERKDKRESSDTSIQFMVPAEDAKYGISEDTVGAGNKVEQEQEVNYAE